jgi:ankyrin repeat protein
LLKRGCSPAEYNAADVRGRVPLYLAAMKGHTNIVQLLLEAGADKDPIMPGGPAPLVIASVNGYIGIVRLLLEYAADKDVNTAIGRSLIVSAEHGHFEIVKVPPPHHDFTPVTM